VHALFLAQNGEISRVAVRTLRDFECGIEPDVVIYETSSGFAKPRDRRSEVRLGGIPEFDDERMAFERLLDDAALDTAAAAVNEANLAKAAFPGRGDVFLDDRFDVARIEGVEIENPLNRNSHRANPKTHIPKPESQVRIPTTSYSDLEFGIWDLGFSSS